MHRICPRIKCIISKPPLDVGLTARHVAIQSTVIRVVLDLFSLVDGVTLVAMVASLARHRPDVRRV